MTGTHTLLIVDDCEADREVCRRYLQKDPHQSYHILEADSAEGGLLLFQQKKCDAILLDFCMPTMDGLEFLTALKQHSLEANVPVILLTGHGAEEVAVQAMKMGAQDYLSKQRLDPNLLQLTVRNVLQHGYVPLQSNQVEQRRIAHALTLHLCQSRDCDQLLQQAATDIYQLLNCDGVAIYQLNRLHRPQDYSAQNQAFTEGSHPSFVSWTKRAEVGVTENPLSTPELRSQKLHSPESSAPGLSLPGLDLPGLDLPEQWLDQGLPAAPSWLHLATVEDSVPSVWLGWVTANHLLLPIGVPLEQSSPEAGHTAPWGVLVAHAQATAWSWQSGEVALLQELLPALALAIQQAEQFGEMQQALAQMQQHSAFQSQMVATISHDYRSPLTTILAAVSTLKQHPQLDPVKQQRFLAMIEEKARFMAKRVDELQILEKLELGKVPFNPMPFNVLEFVADVVEAQQQLVGQAQEFVFQISGNPKGFWGDQDLLRQILVSLLTYGSQGTAEAEPVVLHLRGTETHCTFSIQVQGVELVGAEQILPQPAQPGKKPGSMLGTASGTGLGLAITKACVDLHQGKITLDSTAAGTTITVCLPKRASR